MFFFQDVNPALKFAAANNVTHHLEKLTKDGITGVTL